MRAKTDLAIVNGRINVFLPHSVKTLCTSVLKKKLKACAMCMDLGTSSCAVCIAHHSSLLIPLVCSMFGAKGFHNMCTCELLDQKKNRTANQSLWAAYRYIIHMHVSIHIHVCTLCSPNAYNCVIPP